MEEGDLVQTIIEGLNHSEKNSYLSRCEENLEIPDDATHIKDGDFIYRIYGRADKDFKIIMLWNYSVSRTIFIERLKNLTHVSRPRTLISKDGRIFVEQSTSLDTGYMNLLEKEIIGEAGKVFKEKRE